MVSHLLSYLQLAAIAQVFSDTGGPEGMAANLGLDAGLLCRPVPPAC